MKTPIKTGLYIGMRNYISRLNFIFVLLNKLIYWAFVFLLFWLMKHNDPESVEVRHPRCVFRIS